MNKMRWFLLCFIISGSLLADTSQTLQSRDGVMKESIDLPPPSFPFMLSLGSGVSFLNGKLGQAVQVGVEKQLASNGLFVGLDIDVNFWNPMALNGGKLSVGRSIAVSIMPSFGRQVALGRNWSFLLGLSVGPTRFFTEGGGGEPVRGVVSKNPGSSQSLRAGEKEWSFAALAKPGVSTTFGRALSFRLEPRFGILDLDFVFLPRLLLSVEL